MPVVASKGSGSTRDAFISFKVPGALVASAAPDALVVEETGPSMQGWYEHGSPTRGMSSYADLVGLARAAAAEDGASIGRVFLAGHSEGGEAIRTHLIEGARPDGIVVSDGTYTPLNDTGPRTQVWSDYLSDARSCSVIAVASHASLPATLGRSPQATLELATGWKMPTSDAVSELARQTDGCLLVHSYGGRDGAAHMYQRDVVLPQMIAEARAMRTRPPVVSYAAVAVGVVAGALVASVLVNA